MVVRNNGFVGARDFVLRIRQGEVFLFDPKCLYSKYSEFCGEFKKWMKNTKKKDFDPDPTSGSDLGGWEPELMGKFFLKKNITPLVYVQNDQRVMGIIFRYVCWGTYQPPPPPPRGARRLTARPADPRGLGQPSPPPPPPPTTPKTVAYPSGSHLGWPQPPWERED